MKKKDNIIKTILGVVVSVLAITATVSIIRNINKPGDEPSISVPAVDDRQNLATFNFVTDSDNYQLDTQEKVVAFLTSTTTNSKTGIFGTLLKTSSFTTTGDGKPVEENHAVKLFQSKELGLRLGSSKSLGGLGINLNDGFTFNHAKVSAVNYHRLKTAAEEDGTFNYSKQTGGSSYTLNAKPVSLPMNEDLKVADEVIETIFEFDSAQNQLIINGTLGRPCLLSLELWTE